MEHGWESEDEVVAFVASLKEQRFVLSEEQRYLSVIPLTDRAEAVASKAA